MNPTSVPCPREVWRAAISGRRISVRVNPKRRGSVITLTGTVTDRRKVGNDATAIISVMFAPAGDIQSVEIEAEKERGQWGPFRAHAYERLGFGDDEPLRFLGRVVGLDIPEGRWNATDPGEDGDGGAVTHA